MFLIIVGNSISRDLKVSSVEESFIVKWVFLKVQKHLLLKVCMGSFLPFMWVKNGYIFMQILGFHFIIFESLCFHEQLKQGQTNLVCNISSAPFYPDYLQKMLE